MRRLAVGLILLSVTAPAWAVSDPAEMLPDHSQELRAEAIGSQLRCLVCQNESIEDSGADLARDLRHVVRVHVARGESNAQVMQWMVSRYGDFIRLRPRLSPTTALLWAMPVLALLVGGLLAWFGVRRRTGQPPAPLDEAERARLAGLLQ
jgi:cytochrome c-type biogenesis protein CcmH